MTIGAMETHKVLFTIFVLIDFLFLGLSLLFKYKINVKEIIYYLITIVTLVLSSMIGINFKKQKK